MGGEGSIAAMISSLKNNSKLLSKRPSYFDRGKKIPKSKQNGHFADVLPRMSEAERVQFVEELKKARRSHDIKRMALLVSLVLLMLFFVWVFGY